MHLKARILGIFLVLGHPSLFGVYFCLNGMLVDGKSGLLTSLYAELLSAVVCVLFLHRSLRELAELRFAPLERNARIMVGAACLVCLALALVNLSNAETSGLLSKGGSRLDFYFANDWFRRLVTFSYVPLAVAAYYAMYAVLSPACRKRRALFIVFLVALLISSLLAGSKGAAILIIAGAIPFVFTIRPLPIARMSLLLLLATAAYLAIFLTLSSDASVSLLNIVMRFYLSIDMSILLVGGHGTAELIGAQLGDVWVEVFRNLAALGVRISNEPIGVMVYQYTMGTVPTVGSNCRFGSLLLLYPDRLDFLLLYPALVSAMAVLLGEIFKIAKLPRAALVAIPCFVFQSFQDAYWFAGHVIPILFAFGVLWVGKAISRGSIHRTAHAA